MDLCRALSNVRPDQEEFEDEDDLMLSALLVKINAFPHYQYGMDWTLKWSPLLEGQTDERGQ